MDQKLKKKWVKALRSGEYEQADSVLCTIDGSAFCCLGVLADVQGAVWSEPNSGFDEGLYPIIKGIRPSKQYDLPAPREAGGLRKSILKGLAELNDDGKTFAEIADYIEAKL